MVQYTVTRRQLIFNPKVIAKKFDQHLKEHDLEFSGVVVGGAALVLLDIVTRTTKDFDFLVDQVPSDIKDASIRFAKRESLPEDWFNSGPSNLIKYLPNNWQSQLELIYKGSALTLYTIARIELLKAKVWAYCDRTKDYQDIIAMQPSSCDLEIVRVWLYPLDQNPDWPTWVDTCIQKIKEGLGHGD